MLNLLEAVDDAVREADEVERRQKLRTPAPREMTETIQVIEPFVVESRPPAPKEVERPLTNVSIEIDMDDEVDSSEASGAAASAADAVLMPTMVGQPPPSPASAGSDDATAEIVRPKTAKKRDANRTSHEKGATPAAGFEEGEDTFLGGMLPEK